MMGVFVQVNEDSQMGRAIPVGYVIEENGCWSWVGAKTPDGYGVWGSGRMGHTNRAHRILYEQEKGPIPPSMTLDHLCRNRDCVNPIHLEIVTNKENVLRGVGHTAQNARKTKCKRGHLFDENNTGIDAKGRYCRLCKRASRPAASFVAALGEDV